jgi:parallel beta-helix repeat protein
MTREMSVKTSPVTSAADPIIIVPDNYTTIQEAIDNASSGDTIFVRKGTYNEHVVVNKTIILVGEDPTVTIIDGLGTDDIIFVRANNVTVKDFTLRNSGKYKSGIVIDHSVGNVITNNKIINNYEGIALLFSSNNVVSGNTVSDNNDGITFLYSGNNVVSGNTVSSNYDGVYLDYSSNNVVSSNVISHNDLAGMELYHPETSSNVICGNTILSNYLGINLALLSSNNSIYHNNFDNEYEAWSESTNFWNYTGEGNYWSDYAGQDLNEDGIGDTPYDIDAVNKDNYPLMGMFSNFSITLEREIYSVTIISNSTISDFSFLIGTETGNKMIHFNVTGEAGTLGFCRVKIPTGLMHYPYIALIDSEEIIPTLLSVSNEAYAYLYFTYLHRNHTITIISSKTLALYFDLLDGYLQLNETYYALLENYNILLSSFATLLSNFTQLQISFTELNNTYQTLSGLNRTYYELLDNYLKLQVNLHDLNETYYALSGNYSQLQIILKDLNNSYLEHLLDFSTLLGNYNILLYNYTQLQTSFNDLNDSYQKHLSDYSEQMQNIQSLTYIFVALTAILIITTVYLSKRAHANAATKVKAMEEK